jgi:hypothetical protein
MKNSNTHLLALALSIVFMVTACGKNMNMRVAGSNATGTNKAGTIDASKLAAPAVTLSSDQEFQEFSEFDKQDKTAVISEGAITKRVTLQIPPKEAVNQVLQVLLTLDHTVLAQPGIASICLSESASTCADLGKFIKDPTATTLQVDLRDAFGLTEKTNAEVMDWIIANSTEYAAPGYRKLRFNFPGVTSIPCGELLITTITNDKLPKDFATAPTSFKNGPTDQVTIVPAPAAVTTETTDTP